MQYKLKILPSILFSASGCSRQQTHFLYVGLILHRSQVDQSVPSNVPIVYFFVFAFAILRIRDTFWLKAVKLNMSHDLEYKKHLLNRMTSRLVA